MTGMTKCGFRIMTCSGMTVENLTVQARSPEDAETRIRQIYQRCEILECREIAAGNRGDSVDLESMISLISKQDEQG